jgi:hypothetical protein
MAPPRTNVTLGNRWLERLRIAAFAIALFGTPSQSAAAQIPSVDSLQTVLKRATYVFEGIVQRWGAVADSSLTATPRTAVVHVSRVFSCPQQVGEFGNEDVTIAFHDSSAAPAGTNAWFLGTGWAVGNHIATSIVSVVRTPTTLHIDSLLVNLREAIRLSAKDALRAIVNAADVVVLATVRTISGPKYAAASTRGEYAERWATVQLTVDSVRASRDTSKTDTPTFAAVWVLPRASFRSIAILAPATIGYYSPGTSQLSAGVQRMFVLDSVARRPNLHNVDATAVAFVPNDQNIRDVADAALLGAALPNRVFTMEPTHQCSQPLR